MMQKPPQRTQMSLLRTHGSPWEKARISKLSGPSGQSRTHEPRQTRRRLYALHADPSGRGSHRRSPALARLHHLRRAKNRLHAQKAILAWCLEESGVHVKRAAQLNYFALYWFAFQRHTDVMWISEELMKKLAVIFVRLFRISRKIISPLLRRASPSPLHGMAAFRAGVLHFAIRLFLQLLLLAATEL